jgi:hypothetical protein
MNQRDTLVHLFAGGYGERGAWAAGEGLRGAARREPGPEEAARGMRGLGASVRVATGLAELARPGPAWGWGEQGGNCGGR